MGNVCVRACEAYIKASHRAMEALGRYSGVLAAYNVNIDALKFIRPGFTESAIRNASVSEETILDEIKNPPRAIKSREDLFAGLILNFSRGSAAEWLVQNKTVFDWMKHEVGHDELRMGGQAGIISNNLAALGVGRIMVHSAQMSPKQAGLFSKSKSIVVPRKSGRAFTLRHPSDAVNEKDDELVHFIMEFRKDDVILVGNKSFSCPRDNRFIATYDGKNSNLFINPDFAEGIKSFAKDIDCAILAGFHLLSPKIDYGSRINEAMGVIDGIKSRNPHLKTHAEMASTQDAGVRLAIAERVLSRVDSIGINEQELCDLLEVFGEENLARRIRTTHSTSGDESTLKSVLIYEGLLKLMREYIRPKRLNLHTLGFYITMINRNGWETDSKTVRDSMLFAASLAATRLKGNALGDLEGLDEAVGSVPVSSAGADELESLFSHLGADASEKSEGIIALDDDGGLTLIAVPSLVVSRPKSTVGLGDLISSSTFVSELALNRKAAKLKKGRSPQ